MFTKLSAVFLILIMLGVIGCAAHTHKVREGAQNTNVSKARQWYFLWGLSPINYVDTNAMAAGATDYEIKTAVRPMDFIISTVMGVGIISTRTITVSGIGLSTETGSTETEEKSTDTGPAKTGMEPVAVDMDVLIDAPEPYIGSRVKVSAEIYDIVREGEGVIGRSFTISLTSETRAELLKCEFERGKDSPPHYLRDGQLVTIIGVVDVVQGETMLRKCRVE